MTKKNWDIIGIFLCGTGILVVTVLVYADYFQPEWKGYQQEFREMVVKRYGDARAAQVPSGLQQVWARDLDRVDRCTTCHQAVEWKGFESAPEPFRTHNADVLKKHPIEVYGCSSCHGGQGYATDMESAHATDLKDWQQPMLGKDVSKTYSVSDWRAPMQINCNGCHRYDRETAGAGYINEAKALVQQKGCRACHTINGRGGVIGPDLTYEGDKSTEQHDYSRLVGVESEFAWHVAHLKEPKAMSPTSVMPNFGFNTHQAQALSLLVMSWKRNPVPAQFVVGPKAGDFPSPEEQAKEQQMLSGEGAFFVKHTCFVCHDVSTFGIESATKIGPDLAKAVTDVPSRFGRQLDDFLMSPTGTMSVVLSTQIQLTDDERREAIAKLKIANQKLVAQEIQSSKGKK
jgi:mono/diheme cytochrome c family protein